MYLIDFDDMTHTVYNFLKNLKLISSYFFFKKYGLLKVNVKMSLLHSPMREERAVKGSVK